MGIHRSTSYADLKDCGLTEVRAAIRSGAYTSHTAGLGRGYLQTNLVIIPEAYALDFMRFCQRNPKPCPLAGVTGTGDPNLSTLGSDLDLRTDVPAYNVYRDGVLDESVADISALWREDLVGFALGCSFTFEHALMDAGIRLWHIDQNTTVPMYRSNIQTEPAGPFGGEVVVSMRAISRDRVDEARAISSRFPLAHGSPVWWDEPRGIGISDLSFPDWGNPIEVAKGEVPVFWACGVTPQVALENAKLPFCITHKPGHMLITDVPEDAQIPILSSKHEPQRNTQ